MSLLERDVLAHLLLLGGARTPRETADEALDPLRDRMAEWILAARGDAPAGEQARVPPHRSLSLRRLRALLHLVDSDMGDDEDDPQRAARLRGAGFASRARWSSASSATRRLPSAARIVAALARALDALCAWAPATWSTRCSS